MSTIKNIFEETANLLKENELSLDNLTPSMIEDIYKMTKSHTDNSVTNIKEQDEPIDTQGGEIVRGDTDTSWSSGDEFSDEFSDDELEKRRTYPDKNEKDMIIKEPFTKLEVRILNLLHKHLTRTELQELSNETPSGYGGGTDAKFWDIMKLFGIKHQHDVVQDTRTSKYAKWALDNWTKEGDYGNIENPIKVPLKWYDINRDESGSQIEYKSGQAEVLGFDDEDAGDRADTDFYAWDGEMETMDYGDYEQYDSEIVNSQYLRMDDETLQESIRRNLKEQNKELDDRTRALISIGGIQRDKLTSPDFIKNILKSSGHKAISSGLEDDGDDYNTFYTPGTDINLDDDLQRVRDRIRFEEYGDSFKRGVETRGSAFEGMLAGLFDGKTIPGNPKEDIEVGGEYYSVKQANPGDAWDTGSLMIGYDFAVENMLRDNFSEEEIPPTPVDLMVAGDDYIQYKAQMLTESFKTSNGVPLKWIFAHVLDGKHIEYDVMDSEELISAILSSDCSQGTKSQSCAVGQSRKSNTGLRIKSRFVLGNPKMITFPSVTEEDIRSIIYDPEGDRTEDKIRRIFKDPNKVSQYTVDYIRDNPTEFLAAVNAILPTLTNEEKNLAYTLLVEESDVFGQGLSGTIDPEEFEGDDEEWEELVDDVEDDEFVVEPEYKYEGGKTDPESGFVAPSAEVTDNICKVKGFCEAQGPITFGQLKALVEEATKKRIKADIGRGVFKSLWRIVPFFIPQILLAAVGVTVTRAFNKIITPALKDTGGYKSWWGKVVLKAMDVAEGDYIPDVALGDDPLSKIFFISDGLLQMIRDKYKLKFARYVADVATAQPDNKPVPEWFVENLLRDYLNQKFLLSPPLPVKYNIDTKEQIEESKNPFGLLGDDWKEQIINHEKNLSTNELKYKKLADQLDGMTITIPVDINDGEEPDIEITDITFTLANPYIFQGLRGDFFNMYDDDDGEPINRLVIKYDLVFIGVEPGSFLGELLDANTINRPEGLDIWQPFGMSIERLMELLDGEAFEINGHIMTKYFKLYGLTTGKLGKIYESRPLQESKGVPIVHYSDEQKTLFDYWAKFGPTLEPSSMKLLGYDMSKHSHSVVVWENLKDYYGDEELDNIIQDRLEGLHDSWSYEYIVTEWSWVGGGIDLSVLVNGDAQVPMAQESGGVIDMSLWDINEVSNADDYQYDDVYDEVRSTIGDDIREVLLKDLPVDTDLEYLDISEPGTFEEIVGQHEVKMINEHKEEINQPLTMGDIIRVVDVDKEATYEQPKYDYNTGNDVGNSLMTNHHREQVHGEDTYPRPMKLYMVTSKSTYRPKDRDYLNPYWMIWPVDKDGEVQTIKDLHQPILTEKDTWMTIKKHHSNIPGDIEAKQKEYDDSGRNITSRLLDEHKEQEQPGLSPELTYGDTILVVDIDRERENGTTVYNVPSEQMRPERYTPYTVVDKESNGHKSQWRWRYILVPEDKLEEYEESLDKGWGDYEGYEKLLYPWIYEWIFAKTPKANKVDRLTITEHKETKINPELEVGDKIIVLDIDGERGNEPEKWKEYKVMTKGGWGNMKSDRYDIISTDDDDFEGYMVNDPVIKRLYRGDTWIYTNVDRKTINEHGADTSWTDDDDTVTLQDILELTKDIPIISYPTKELAKIPSLKKLVLGWDPEEIERISQVDVSRQYPILVMVNEYNEVQWILDGNHRAQQAVMNDIPTIPTKLIKPSDLDERTIKMFYPEGIPGTNQTISEHTETKVNPELEVGDIVRVIDVDGEHTRMPERFGKYKVVKVGGVEGYSFQNTFQGYYDMIPYPDVESRAIRHYEELGAHHQDSDFTLYRGDTWIYGETPMANEVDRKTISEHKESKISPDLMVGDEIIVVSTEGIHDFGLPELYKPYVVVGTKYFQKNNFQKYDKPFYQIEPIGMDDKERLGHILAGGGRAKPLYIYPEESVPQTFPQSGRVDQWILRKGFRRGETWVPTPEAFNEHENKETGELYEDRTPSYPGTPDTFRKNHNDDKLKIPQETFVSYLDEHHKEKLTENLMPILQCIAHNCYGEDVDSDDRTEWMEEENCMSCNEALTDTLQDLDRAIVKLGFIESGNGSYGVPKERRRNDYPILDNILHKPFPFTYNDWLENIIQEVDPKFFINKSDDIVYMDIDKNSITTINEQEADHDTPNLTNRFIKDFWPKHSSQLYSQLYNTYHPSTYTESFNRPSGYFEDALEIVADAVHEGKKLGLLDSSVDWSDMYHYELNQQYSSPTNQLERKYIDDDGVPTLHNQLEIMDNTNLDWIHGILLFDVLEDIVDEFKHYCGENGIDESGMGKCIDEFPPSPVEGTNKPENSGTLKQDYYTLFNFMKDLERAGVPVTDYLKNPTYPNIIKLTDDGSTDYDTTGEYSPMRQDDEAIDTEKVFKSFGIEPDRIDEEEEGYIDDMVYRDEPREKHVRKMAKDLGSLEGFPIGEFKNVPPPTNESNKTEEEIGYLEDIPVDKNLVDSADAMSNHFSNFLSTKGLDYPKEELRPVMRGVKAIILKLKYHYNRPRPWQIANVKGLELNSETLKSSSSPSYPSGHATQGRFVARYLADLYPEYRDELTQMGEDIAFSRNMAKVHYPSDSAFGKLLGDSMYEYVYQPQEELEMELDEYCPMGRPNKCELVDYDKLPDTIHEYVDKKLDKKLKLNKGGEFNEEETKECTKGMYYCTEDEICKPDSQKLKEQYELQTPTERKKIELTSYLFPVLDDNFVITPHPRGEINYDGRQMAIFSYDEDRFIMVEDLYNAIEGMIQKGLPQEETELIVDVMTEWINSRMTIKPELYEQIPIQKVVRKTINEIVGPDDRKVPGRYYEWVPIPTNNRVSTHVV